MIDKEPEPVTWLVPPSGERIDPYRLAEILGVALPDDASAVNTCKICGRLGNLGGRFHYCAPCVEVVQDEHRCPDCDSRATVIVEEGVPHLVITVGHHDTCPTWRAIRDAS